jgi:hypothetical protein
MEICAPFSQNHNQQKQEPNHPYKNLPTKRKETIKGPITKKKKKALIVYRDSPINTEAAMPMKSSTKLTWEMKGSAEISSLFSLFSAIFPLSLPSNLSPYFPFRFASCIVCTNFQSGYCYFHV